MIRPDAPCAGSGMRLPIAVAARAYPGETVSGDAWIVQWQGPGEGREALVAGCRVAVIDGLGHGPEAAKAAQAAVAALTAHPDAAPEAAQRLCDQALRHTRGAAVAVAALDFAAGTLHFAGVGNVEAHLWAAGRSQRLISYRGIVGSAMPTVRQFEFPLGDDWLLVLHSDGVSARFSLATLPEFQSKDRPAQLAAQALADTILAGWGRATDDATVLVVDGRR